MELPSTPRPGLQRLADQSYLVQIPAGELRLRMSREELPLAEALDFAARNNAQRRFLFVSKVLGRHLPTRPGQIRAAAALLAQKLLAANLAQPCLFIGMAETATTLGQAVFREWMQLGGRGLYLDSTRRRTAGELAFTFTEAHSHAPGHLIHCPRPGDDPENVFNQAHTLVIIDDEMTTGRTAAQLATAYAAHRGHFVETHLAVLVRWAAPPDPAVHLNLHALLEGEFEFSPAADFVPLPLASPHHTLAVVAADGTRHGLTDPQSSPWLEKGAGCVLVIGAGEFGFQPLRLAEQIEANGGEAYLQATTRSPVALGGAVQHIRAFPALSGEGYCEFLYNVPDNHCFDRVILCCEEDLPPATHPIWTLPRLECRRA